MNIQNEVQKIHAKYGVTEKANYEIQLLCEKYADKYHQSKLKNNGDLGDVSNTYKPNCSECGDRGWIYNEDGSKNRICPCHY